MKRMFLISFLLSFFLLSSSNGIIRPKFLYKIDEKIKEKIQERIREYFPFDSVYQAADTIEFNIDGRKGLIDHEGTLLIYPVAERIFRYSEGMVGFYEGFCRSYSLAFPCEKIDKNICNPNGCRVGFLDKNGIVIPAKFEIGSYEVQKNESGFTKYSLKTKWYDIEFHEGLARITLQTKPDLKDGYIDKSGNIVIPAKFDEARHFKNGKAAVLYNGKWQFIDKKGQFIEKISEKDKAELKEISLKKDVGVKKQPNPIRDNEFVRIAETDKEQAEVFKQDGLIKTVKETPVDLRVDKTYGMKTVSGKVLIPTECDSLVKYKDLYLCRLTNIQDKYIGYDKNGKQVFNSENPKEYKGDVAKFNSFIKIKIGNQYTLIDTNGEYRKDRVFDDIVSIFNGLSVVKKANRYGLIKENGEFLKIKE